MIVLIVLLGCTKPEDDDAMAESVGLEHLWDKKRLQLDVKEAEIKSHTGPTDILCSGSTQKLVAYTNGLGKIDLSAMASNETFVVNVNSASISVSADSILRAFIEGDGDIFYKGDPVIELKDIADGALIKVE